MSAVTVEACQLIRRIAPAVDGENVKSRIWAAARKLRWKETRARAVWHGDTRIRLRVEELDQLRAQAARQTKEAINELEQLRATVARLAARVERIDADFYGATADALRRQVRSGD